jgi:ATP-dependent 26S proteasome regulatory subunit
MFDGINECSGRIIIMTSNKPEVLDKALIRPGRIDIKINFNSCTRYDVMRLVNLFWDLELSEEMLLPELELKYTSAEIYNIFRSTNDFSEIEELFLTTF